MRSVTRMLALFGAPPTLVRSWKPRLSMTSVSPSQRPRALPVNCAISGYAELSSLNDARLVDHLVRDRHDSRALEDLDAVAVDRGVHAVADTAADTAVIQREILERIEPVVAERAVLRLPARASRIGDGRLATVRRIDDQRRVAERARAPLITQEASRRRGASSPVVLRGTARARNWSCGSDSWLPSACGRSRGMPRMSSVL